LSSFSIHAFSTCHLYKYVITTVSVILLSLAGFAQGDALLIKHCFNVYSFSVIPNSKSVLQFYLMLLSKPHTLFQIPVQKRKRREKISSVIAILR